MGPLHHVNHSVYSIMHHSPSEPRGTEYGTPRPVLGALRSGFSVTFVMRGCAPPASPHTWSLRGNLVIWYGPKPAINPGLGATIQRASVPKSWTSPHAVSRSVATYPFKPPLPTIPSTGMQLWIEHRRTIGISNLRRILPTQIRFQTSSLKSPLKPIVYLLCSNQSFGQTTNKAALIPRTFFLQFQEQKRKKKPLGFWRKS